MLEQLQSLLRVDFSSVLIGIFLIFEILKWTINAFEWLVRKCGIEFRWMNNRNKEHELLISTHHRLQSLENQREIDVTESIRHDKAIKEDLIKVSSVVEQIIEKLNAMEAKNDASELAKLKDRIAQAYRKYHDTGSWTKMDKESYDGLIRDYEAHGGKNSFVHTICEPESYTWKILDD